MGLCALLNLKSHHMREQSDVRSLQFKYNFGGISREFVAKIACVNETLEFDTV